jgi:hypothetical protein
MNKYQVIDKYNRSGYVQAYTTYEAQQKGARMMGAKKSYEITVVLVELEGKEYVHSAGSL